ncbi:MAG: right-handed parallel beta-helix repeat-containing protein [Planctomycetes bacterium]|nr:right-handed parallel beta-helix repeat-containing protein [Planctomycetota bacterium]
MSGLPRAAPRPGLGAPAAVLALLAWLGLSPALPLPARADPPAAATTPGAADAPLEEIRLTGDDQLLTRSARIAPGTYRLPDAGDLGVVRIKGDDLTLDFQGAVLAGAPDDLAADQYRGWGVVASGCRNLTLKNLHVRGFKLGFYFKECDGLTLTGCDVSDNWRARLKSTPRAEDGSDWLFGHENDANEWFRYGAGIYVERSRGITLAGNRARRGQNGICLSRVEDSWIYDNDMSFLSGWGLALWRSSRNEVSHNKFDWCIRGFSFGVYHRGQDSAGILVYEQSSDNVFAWNSATHGGDGFFLYAGNETLQRTGVGGCNRNLVYRNDFSHAAANGIEATFSQGNRFVENRLEECEYGVWAGYSYGTLLLGNRIRGCGVGVAIEHGQDNRLEGNDFEGDQLGVKLWSSPNEDFQKTVYGRTRPTPSRGYLIAKNAFRKEASAAIELAGTVDVSISENVVEAPIALRYDGACQGVRLGRFEGRVEAAAPGPVRGEVAIPPVRVEPPSVRGTLDALLPEGATRGRRFIFVDEWGPYDFRAPRLFPSTVSGAGEAEVYALGPAGAYQVLTVEGEVEVTPAAGRLPGTLRIAPKRSGLLPFRARVRIGEATLEVAGTLVAAEWEVRFYKWKGRGPKRPPEDWTAVVAAAPLESRKLDRIDFTWGAQPPGERVPADYFATVGTTELDFPAGAYDFRTRSDDGVRVWVDDRPVIDDWTWHGPTEDRGTVSLAAGKHRLRIEHFELDGHAQLQLWIEPRR